MMSMHEANHKHFELTTSCPVRLLAKCAHEDNCEIEVDAAYKPAQGNL